MHGHRHLRLDRRRHKPQFLGGLGEELGEGSSVQQTAEEEFGELSIMLGDPHICLEISTDAAAALLEQASPDSQKIRDKLLQLAVQHSAPLKRWDPRDPRRRTRHVASCGRSKVVADVDIKVRCFVLAQKKFNWFINAQCCNSSSRRLCGICPLRYGQNDFIVRSAPLFSKQRETTSYHILLEFGRPDPNNQLPKKDALKCFTTVHRSSLFVFSSTDAHVHTVSVSVTCRCLKRTKCGYV